jgi:predicted transcriptional regulator
MNSIHDIRDMARLHKIQMKQVCTLAQIQQPQVSRWLSGAVDPLWCSVNQMEQALFELIERQATQGQCAADTESTQP